MSDSVVHHFKCDLCAAEGQTSSGSLPAGWVKVVIENRYVDRDFTDKHVCRGCVNVIKEEQP